MCYVVPMRRSFFLFFICSWLFSSVPTWYKVSFAPRYVGLQSESTFKKSVGMLIDKKRGLMLVYTDNATYFTGDERCYIYSATHGSMDAHIVFIDHPTSTLIMQIEDSFLDNIANDEEVRFAQETVHQGQEVFLFHATPYFKELHKRILEEPSINNKMRVTVACPLECEDVVQGMLLLNKDNKCCGVMQGRRRNMRVMDIGGIRDLVAAFKKKGKNTKRGFLPATSLKGGFLVDRCCFDGIDTATLPKGIMERYGYAQQLIVKNVRMPVEENAPHIGDVVLSLHYQGCEHDISRNPDLLQSFLDKAAEDNAPMIQLTVLRRGVKKTVQTPVSNSLDYAPKRLFYWGPLLFTDARVPGMEGMGGVVMRFADPFTPYSQGDRFFVQSANGQVVKNFSDLVDIAMLACQNIALSGIDLLLTSTNKGCFLPSKKLSRFVNLEQQCTKRAGWAA